MPKEIKVGVNGPGAIGGTFIQYTADNHDFEVSTEAINYYREVPAAIADRLNFDTMYLHWRKGGDRAKRVQVSTHPSVLLIDGKPVRLFSNENPASIQWALAGVDLVIESSRVESHEQALKHITEKGAKRVLVSASAKEDGMPEYVYGVNHELFDPEKDKVVYASSCTTNCLVTTLDVLDKAFGVEMVSAQATHALTSTDYLYDPIGGEAIPDNSVPESTGASIALARIMPQFKDIDRIVKANRVDTQVGSLLDLTVRVSQTVTPANVVEAYQAAAAGYLNGVIELTDRKKLSAKYVKGEPFAAVISKPDIQVGLSGRTIAIHAGYDNVLGYVSQLARLAAYIGQHS